VQDLWSEQRISGVKLGDDHSIAADLIVGADGRNSIVRQRANLALEVPNFDILWFKLADSPRFEAENVFYSILMVVTDLDCFGVGGQSPGGLGAP